MWNSIFKFSIGLILCFFATRQRAISQTNEVTFNTSRLSPAIPAANHNLDLWGYAANGKEYALLARWLDPIALGIVDVTNPATIFDIPVVGLSQSSGPDALEVKDIKTYGHYAYAIDDANSGLGIYDLSGLANTNPSIEYKGLYQFPANSSTTFHNMWINDDGLLFIAGNSSGIYVADVSITPEAPTLVQTIPSGPQHDVISYDNTLVASSKSQNTVTFYDFSDLDNIDAFYTIHTHGAHNAWYSEEKEILITTDEVSGTAAAYLRIWDIHELNFLGPSGTATMLTEYQLPFNPTQPPHNVAIKDEYAYIAYFQEGMVILDITCPDAPLLVAHFDYDNTSGTINTGCRMVYPYLPSGRIIISEYTEGVIVVDFNDTLIDLDLHFTTDVFSGTQVHQTKRDIIAESFAEIQTIDDITFEAGNMVHLKDGFHATGGSSFPAGGSTFNAKIDPYCMGNYILYRGSSNNSAEKEEESKFNWIESNINTSPTGQKIISLYPNPSNGSFTLEIMDEQEIMQVVVADILGKVVSSEMGNGATNYSNTIDLSMYDKGIYFVRVQYENKLEVRKVVYR